MLGIVQSSSAGHINYVNRGQGARGYRGPISDPDRLPSQSSLTTTFDMDFLVEAYVARPVEVIIKKTWACT